MLWPTNFTGDATKVFDAIAQIMQSSHKGVVKLLNVCFGKKVAAAERDVVLQMAQTKVDEAAILAGDKRFESGVLMDVLKLEESENILNALSLQKQIDEIRCFISAMKDVVAKIECKREDEISDDPISKTFFNRWRKEVELVDDEALRDLWARVLAEEVCHPNSIALQTLEAVRRLSKEDAMSFQRILKGSINACIPKNPEGHVQYGSYTDILALQDIGLVQTSGITTQTYTGNYDILDRHKCAVILLEDCPYALIIDGVYRVNCYTLSRAGKDLSRIALLPRNTEDIISMAEYLLKTNAPKSELSLHLVLRDKNGQQMVLDNNMWSSKKSHAVGPKPATLQ